MSKEPGGFLFSGAIFRQKEMVGRMIYNFDTDDRNAAVGALIVYAVYRSREKNFKVTPDMWGRIERFVVSAAKRSNDLGEFLQKLKPKMKCSSVKPKYIKSSEGQEMAEIFRYPDQKKVLECLYKKGATVILLVRERIEREREEIKDDDDDEL
ncbi:MAG: hypothetical protein ACUVSK_06490 [Desulfotomaculales bacterium]